MWNLLKDLVLFVVVIAFLLFGYVKLFGAEPGARTSAQAQAKARVQVAMVMTLAAEAERERANPPRPDPTPGPQAKTCPCSTECTCGCNEGQPCRCGPITIVSPTQAAPTYRGWSSAPVVVPQAPSYVTPVPLGSFPGPGGFGRSAGPIYRGGGRGTVCVGGG